MTSVIAISASEQMPAFAAGAITPLDASERVRHAPDRHLLIVEGGTLVARASCWWQATPHLSGERVGLIGHYAAATADAGRRVLAEACAALTQTGCTIAIGPMDGNTWRRYRWVVERGTEPPFFLEPDNPDSAPAEFAAAGFDVLASYTSTLAEDLTLEDPRVTDAESRLVGAGVRIRPLDPSRSHEELRAIYRLSVEAFKANYLYSPIVEAEFVEQNERALPYVDPELVLLAEDARTAGRLSLRDPGRPAEDAGPARLDADREDGGGGARAPLFRSGQRPGGPGASPGPFARIHGGPFTR